MANVQGSSSISSFADGPGTGKRPGIESNSLGNRDEDLLADDSPVVSSSSSSNGATPVEILAIDVAGSLPNGCHCEVRPAAVLAEVRSPGPGILRSNSSSNRNSRAASYSSNRSQSIIKNKGGYKFSLFTFFLCGLGNLLPWNFLITPRGYWMLKLEDHTHRNGTDLGTQFFKILQSDASLETFKLWQAVRPIPQADSLEAAASTDMSATTTTSYFSTSSWVSRPGKTISEKPNQMQDFWENFLSISNMLPMVVAGFLTSFGLILKHSSSFRILVSLKVILFCLLFNQVYIFINVEKMVPVFFITTLIAIVILSFATQVFGCSVAGVATKFGNKHVSVMLIGQAAAGILAAVASIFSILILGREDKDGHFGNHYRSSNDGQRQDGETQIYVRTLFESFITDSDLNVEKAAFFFFLVAIILVLVNLFVYYKFVTTEVYVFLFGESSVNATPARSLVDVTTAEGRLNQALTSEEMSLTNQRNENEFQSSSRTNNNINNEDDLPEDEQQLSNDQVPLLVNAITPRVEPLNWKIFSQTVKLTRSTCFQVCLSNFINLSVFPAICSSFVPENCEEGDNIDLYRSIWVFLNFNLGDCLGRILAGLLNSHVGSNIILNMLHCARLFFLMLIPVCHVALENRSKVPVLIHNDTVFILLTFFLALTNGFLMSVSFTDGISLLISKNKEDLVESAGSIFVLFIAIGLFLGSCFSFVIVGIL